MKIPIGAARLSAMNALTAVPNSIVPAPKRSNVRPPVAVDDEAEAEVRDRRPRPAR